MSNTPINASMDAAVVAGIPWSCAAATKCVPIRPFVDQPQTKNVPTSTQNTLDLLDRASSSNAAPVADPRLAAGGGGTSAASAPSVPSAASAPSVPSAASAPSAPSAP
jgi:hypothetical protein